MPLTKFPWMGLKHKSLKRHLLYVKNTMHLHIGSFLIFLCSLLTGCPLLSEFISLQTWLQRRWIFVFLSASFALFLWSFSSGAGVAVLDICPSWIESNFPQPLAGEESVWGSRFTHGPRNWVEGLSGGKILEVTLSSPPNLIRLVDTPACFPFLSSAVSNL